MALDAIHSIQANETVGKYGCQWYINTSDYNYCFWEFSKKLSAPISDKEICQLLSISLQTVKAEFAAAIEVLKNNKSNINVEDLMSVISNYHQNAHDKEILSYDKSITELFEQVEAPEEENPDDILGYTEKPKRTYKSKMPRHLDGKKVDLYGLYSDRSKQKIIKKYLQ